MATELGTRIAEVRRAAQFNLAEADYRSQADDLSYGIMRDPKLRSDPEAARTALRQQLAPLQQKMRDTYPMADWDGMLSRNMEFWGESRVRVLGHAAIDNLEQDTKADIKAGSTAAITRALTAADPRDRQAAVTNQLQSIRNAYQRGLLTQGEAQLEAQNFEYALNKAQFDQYARQNPGQVLAMQKPEYTDQGGVKHTILPDWLVEGKTKAIDQLESTGKAIDAEVSAQRGQLEAQIVQAKASGQSNSGMLENYMAHGGRQEFYEAFTGNQWIRSNPALVQQFTQQLKDAKPEDIPYILQNATMMRASQAMSSTDLATISAFGMKQHQIAGDVQRQRIIQAKSDLFKEFIPLGTSTMGIPAFGPKVNAEMLNQSWDAALAANKNDPDKAKEQVETEFKKFRLKGAALKGALDRIGP